MQSPLEVQIARSSSAYYRIGVLGCTEALYSSCYEDRPLRV